MVFQDLGQIPISAGKPYTSGSGTAGEWDITAVIGLAGSAKGAVSLSMKKAVALQLTDKLSGGTHIAIDKDVIDLLGEIANIIGGRAKQIMEGEFRFETALPVVIVATGQEVVNGQGHSLNWSESPIRNIRIPFTIFETERFILSVSVQDATANMKQGGIKSIA
jgi:CheY-specific phosphatase CheX